MVLNEGKSHVKTAYSAYNFAWLCELGGSAAHAGCNASSTPTDDYYGTTTNQCSHWFCADGTNSDSERRSNSGESNHDAAQQPDWAADADHNQGGRRPDPKYASAADDP